MKITTQVLKNAAAGSLANAKFLDLSGKRIGGIQCLEGCQRLQTLILHSNTIDTITNLECCSELWNIDLSGNKVRTINGLSQFPFLGTLLLSANALDWTELKKLSHTHLLSLTLNGNTKLTRDKHYRKHVIDLLPHLWMLDGQLITAGERRRVEQFFVTSATTSKPVRRKTNSYSSFLPSSRKNLTITGVFGQRTSSVMTRFPLQENHNIELDRRRLLCLAEMIEEDMKLESEYRERKGQRSFIVPPLKQLIEHRNNEIEQSNMLLLLLVAMLLFNLCEDLLIATFDTAKLTAIGGIKCQELISLPRFVILRIASLLLSAAAIDKESNMDGGLYPQLYQSLQYSIHSLHSKTHLLDNEDVNITHQSLSSTLSGVSNDTYSRSTTPSSTTPSMPSSASSFSLSFPAKTHTPLTSQSAGNFCLLASEVVHLLCLVPLFFELLDFDQDVINMVAIATRNSNVLEVANHIKWSILNNGGNIWDVYHELASYLLQSTTANVFSKRKALPLKLSTPPTSIPQSSSQVFQTPKRHTHLPPPRSQSAGAVASFRRRHMTPLQPDLGDNVLCAPERLARIIAIPEQNVAVLQLNSDIQGMSGPPDSYFYTDTRGLQWDRTQGYWTRDDLASDLSTGRLHPSPDPIRANNTLSPNIDITTTRPTSQLSYISEDLHTIPSLEELSNEEESTMELPIMSKDDESIVDIPIAVNISGRQSVPPTQRTNTPENIVGSISDLVYSFNQQTENISGINDKNTADNEDERECPPLTYEQWVIDKHLSGSLTEGMDLTDLTVSIPKLTHPELWESKKSIPSNRYNSSSSKTPHSCTKRASTTSSSRDISPHGSSGPSVNLSPFHESKPKVVQAWSAPRLGQKPKQTLVSKTRTANRGQQQQQAVHCSSSQQSLSHDSIILYSHHSPTHSPTVPHNTPTHSSTVYNIHSRLAKTKYQFQPVKKTKRTSSAGHPRKLGDLQNLSVLRAYAW